MRRVDAELARARDLRDVSRSNRHGPDKQRDQFREDLVDSSEQGRLSDQDAETVVQTDEAREARVSLSRQDLPT